MATLLYNGHRSDSLSESAEPTPMKSPANSGLLSRVSELGRRGVASASGSMFTTSVGVRQQRGLHSSALQHCSWKKRTYLHGATGTCSSGCWTGCHSRCCSGRCSSSCSDGGSDCRSGCRSGCCRDLAVSRPLGLGGGSCESAGAPLSRETEESRHCSTCDSPAACIVSSGGSASDVA